MFLPKFALVAASVLVASSVFAAPVADASKWDCFDTSLVADNNYGLTVEVGSDGRVSKIDVTHSGFMGARKVATLSLCETTFPAANVADGATTASCHDGAWANGHEAQFVFGGFVPFFGTATLSVGGPEKAAPVADFSCTLRDE